MFIIEDFNILAMLAYSQQILEYSSISITENQENLLSKFAPLSSLMSDSVQTLNQNYSAFSALDAQNEVAQQTGVYRDWDR